MGGIHLNYKVYPDIAIFGKALGNGFAINAVIGKKKLMKKSENTFISSTFWGERVGYTAAIATIEEFKRLKAFSKVSQNGDKIKKIWLKLSLKHNLPIKIMGTNAIPSFEFLNNHLLYKTFLTKKMLENKILATNLVYVNIFHCKKNLIKYEQVLEKVFSEIKKKISIKF